MWSDLYVNTRGRKILLYGMVHAFRKVGPTNEDDTLSWSEPGLDANKLSSACAACDATADPPFVTIDIC